MPLAPALEVRPQPLSRPSSFRQSSIHSPLSAASSVGYTLDSVVPLAEVISPFCAAAGGVPPPALSLPAPIRGGVPAAVPLTLHAAASDLSVWLEQSGATSHSDIADAVACTDSRSSSPPPTLCIGPPDCECGCAEEINARPALERPCPHNDWDDVRTRNGSKCLRCRTCQRKWKLPSKSIPRCSRFLRHDCRRGDACDYLHIHKRKVCAAEREAQFGLQRKGSGRAASLLQPAQAG